MGTQLAEGTPSWGTTWYPFKVPHVVGLQGHTIWGALIHIQTYILTTSRRATFFSNGECPKKRKKAGKNSANTNQERTCRRCGSTLQPRQDTYICPACEWITCE